MPLVIISMLMTRSCSYRSTPLKPVLKQVVQMLALVTSGRGFRLS